MDDKEQIIISVDSDLKTQFRIACLTKKKNMTEVITEFIKSFTEDKNTDKE